MCMVQTSRNLTLQSSSLSQCPPGFQPDSVVIPVLLDLSTFLFTFFPCPSRICRIGRSTVPSNAWRLEKGLLVCPCLRVSTSKAEYRDLDTHLTFQTRHRFYVSRSPSHRNICDIEQWLSKTRITEAVTVVQFLPVVFAA